MFTLSSNRLRFACGIFAVILWGIIKSIRDLTKPPQKIVPGFYPQPRFIKKAMYMGLHRSFMYRYYRSMYALWASMIISQLIHSYCHFFGYKALWLASPLPILSILLALCFLLFVVHFAITFYRFLGRMERRYEMKYKAKDLEKSHALKGKT